MKALFPTVTLIRCFLHAFLKVRNCSKRKQQEQLDECSDKIWDCYRAENKRSFSQKIRRLQEWAEQHMKKGDMKTAVLKLCSRREEFMPFFDNKYAHRTSNMLDRLIRFMDQKIFKGQGFHGSLESANRGVRAFALLKNFAPSGQKAHVNGLKSPAERLNGFAYSESWLENLLIATSINRN